MKDKMFNERESGKNQQTKRIHFTMGRKSLLTSPSPSHSPKSKPQIPKSQIQKGKGEIGLRAVKSFKVDRKRQNMEQSISKILLKSLVIVTDPVDNPELFSHDHNLIMVQACPYRLKVQLDICTLSQIVFNINVYYMNVCSFHLAPHKRQHENKGEQNANNSQLWLHKLFILFIQCQI